MTVSELKSILDTMPDGCHVFILQEEPGVCVLLKSCDYSDTLGDLAGGDDSMNDGVVLTTFKNEG